MKLIQIDKMAVELPDVFVPVGAFTERTKLLLRHKNFAVDSDLNMALAAAWSADIQAFCKTVKKDADAIREPAKAFIGAVNKIEDNLTDDLEGLRKSLNAVQGDYIQAQEAKRKSLEVAQRTELLQIEREREQKLAECDTIEAREAVQEEYSAKVADMAPPIVVVPIPTVAGQRVSEDIDFEVTDIWLLVSSHPNLVKTPEPKRNEIKAHIKAGLPVKGVRWWPKVSVTNVGTAPRMTISLPSVEKQEQVGITID